jgi:NDP-sugar pyrophosphorylase family protein
VRVLVLAGGRGTRLKPLTDKTPKTMVSVHGKPFLQYLLDYHKKHDIILSLGYKANCIKKWCKDNKYVVEFVEEPRRLGVCGAIRFAEEFLSDGKEFAVINGDTFIDEPLDRILKWHRKSDGDVTYVTALDHTTRSYNHAGIYIFSKSAIEKIPWTLQNISEIMYRFYKPQEVISQNKYIDIGTHESLKFCKESMFKEKIIEDIQK